MSQFKSYTDALKNKGIMDPLTRIRQVMFFTSSLPVSVDELAEDDFHVIDSEAKKTMFHRHLPSEAAQKSRAEDILRQFKQLAPAAAARFEAKNDPVEKMVFRLWAQREAAHMREDAFIALSYCCDRTNYPPRPGVKYPLPISTSMFAALASERQWRTTGVWIDQLCIDQVDKEEKSASIAAMDAVYRCAQCVVVALADVEVTPAQQQFLRDFIPDYESPSHEMGFTPHVGETPPYFERHPLLQQLFNSILRSRWFTRAWCTHEMELGENFVFYLPCQSAHRSVLSNHLVAFTSTFLSDMLNLSSEIPGPTDGKDMNDHLSKTFDPMTRIKRVYESVTGIAKNPANDPDLTRSYSAQIRDIFAQGAEGDPDLAPDLRKVTSYLDKTSIVLNTLGTGISVKRQINPSVTQDGCMRRLMLLGLAARDPTVLCTLGPHFVSPTSPSTLSWLCKPTYADLGSGVERRNYLPKISVRLLDSIKIDTTPHQHWIKIDLFALPAPQLPGKQQQDLARELVLKGIELGMGRAPPGPMGDLGAEYEGKTDVESQFMLMTIDMGNPWGQGPLYQYWRLHTFTASHRERFILTLACLLQCGMRWTLRMAAKCGYPKPSHLEEKLGNYFSQDDFSRIEPLDWGRTEASRDAVGALFSAATWVMCWGAVMPHPPSSDYVPMIFDHGPASKALVFSVTDALMQTVVPVPLIRDEYGRLYRVWLLQAKDDPFYDKMMRGEKTTWFLRSKAMLFTDVDAKDIVFSEGSARYGRPGWRLRPAVTVHGPPAEFQREERDT